ncbi:glycosyltransferase family 87 protein [Bradyrhizobium sp.]|uniref:glycosyltransferase family 87 protein n=1 Tax=Bradyrhizobium sp. TaxID=376 RepID=UPI002D270120|nr:glycosyltransferase family 87 protein [Bradyrhizobium sp.]HZR75765.1 glycosyltransferase family 87 protein [Bradyrhizobium sp.]
MRAPLDILFLVCCVVLTADVLGPEIFGHGKTKDYPLWFWAGQQVLHGGDLYPHDPHTTFAFLYPPPAAILLAIPAFFGKIPLYLLLSLLNVIAWWMTAQLSNAMTGDGKTVSPWLAALPSIAMISFTFDMFDLGQPNLVLLAIMLWGFWLVQHDRPWSSGILFALATAIKVFPVAVLPYLVWRRQWASVASTIVFLAVFLIAIPAPIRGFEHNMSELKTWYQGMVGSSSEAGFGQREDQNWSWMNQSLISLTHRLTRPVDYNQDNPNNAPAYMNLLNLDFKTANWVVLGISALIGLGFIAVMPRASRRTPRSDAEELGILFCLMTVASPLARQYYFIWLFFPLTVLLHRAAYDPRDVARRATWIVLAMSAVLVCLSLPVFPHEVQAFGNNFLATALIAAALAWYLLHTIEDKPGSVAGSLSTSTIE